MESVFRSKLPPAYRDTNLEARPGELWEDIPGLDGLYQISNYGRVLRKYRVIYDKLNRPYTISEKIKLAQINKDRNMLMKDWSKRLQVTVQVDNITYHFQICRLVYYCFVEQFDLDDKSLVVSAINGNALDVYPENLELITYEQKNNKSYETGRQLSHFQTNKFKLIEANLLSAAANSILVSSYLLDGTIHKTYPSIKEAAKETGLSNNAIGLAIKRIYTTPGNLYWRKGCDNKINQKELSTLLRQKQKRFRENLGKTITQFGLNGIPLACYAAKSIAAKVTGIAHKQISLSIKGEIKQAGGFTWKEGNYIGKDPGRSYAFANNVGTKDCLRKNPYDLDEYFHGTKVTQFSIEGNPVARFNTISAAAQSVNRTAAPLWIALKNQTKCAGYYWREGHIYDNILINTNRRYRGMKVTQCNLDGKPIAFFESVYAAAASVKKAPASIWNAIKTGNDCANYYWRKGIQSMQLSIK